MEASLTKLNHIRRDIKFYEEALLEEATPEGVNRIRYIINQLRQEKRDVENGYED